MITLTLDQLKRGLQIAEQIEALKKELGGILGAHAAPSAAPVAKTAPAPVKRKKGKMSAEGRARIVAAQKARWAKIRAGKNAPAKAKTEAPKAPEKKKRTMSPAVRAKLAAAMKARWAAAKAGKGPVPTAKTK